jgi:hypothetical protein
VSEPVAVLVRIVLTSLLFAALYLSAVILLHRGYAPIPQVAALLREMVPQGWFSILRTPKTVLQRQPLIRLSIRNAPL